MMLSFWLTTYFSVLISWTLFYTFNSFYSPPRWTRCSNTWNTENCFDYSITELQPHSEPKMTKLLNDSSDAMSPLMNETNTQFLNTSFLMSKEYHQFNSTSSAVEFLQ